MTASCGGPRSTNSARDQETTGESSPVGQETVVPVTGNTATSADGVFSLKFSAHTFSETVVITITSDTTTPSPDATLSKLYKVTYQPAGVEPKEGTSFAATFDLAKAGIESIDGENTSIGFVTDAAEEYGEFITAAYNAEAQTVSSQQVTQLGSYALVDSSLLGTCECDITADVCDEECACDTDCETTGPDPDPDPDPVACAEGEFACGNGTCINESLVCNTLPDCMDGSDEIGCDGGGTPAPTVDPDQYEPDDLSSDATPIASGESQDHSIHRGDEDYMSFSLTERRDVTITTSGITGDTRLYLYTSALSQVGFDDDGGIGSFSSMNVILEAGDYYIKVTGYTASSELGSYSITWNSVTPLDPAPSGVVASLDGQDVVLSWTATVEATSYNVYYTGGTAATEGASPLSATTNSQRLTGLQSGMYYTFTVKGVNAAGAESYESGAATVQIPLQADDFEPNDTFETATPIESGDTRNHSIHVATDLDYAVFTLTRLSNVTIETEGQTGDGQLYLYDENQVQIAYNYDGGNGLFSLIGAYDFPNGLEAGTYYIKAQSYYNYNTLPAYTLSFTAEEIIVPDGPVDAFESDDTVATATDLVSGTPQTHSIHRDADVDFFKITLTEQSDLVIQTSGTIGDTLMVLYDASETELTSDDNGGDGTFSRITQTAAAPGTYYVSVVSAAGSGQIASYDITLTAYAYPAVPTNVQANRTGGIISISWDAVTGAESYEVLYQVQDDPFNFVTATEGASPLSTTTTSQAITGLPTDKQVYISVRAANGTAVGAISELLTISAD